MVESKRIPARFGKEFTEEQFNEIHALLGLGDRSDTVRKLLAMGYLILKNKEENKAKGKAYLTSLGLVAEDLI